METVKKAPPPCGTIRHLCELRLNITFLLRGLKKKKAMESVLKDLYFSLQLPPAI
jgi:hypothetical protein